MTKHVMVQSLLSLVEIRDAETGRHSRRTQQYARVLAQELATHPEFCEYLTPERIDLLSTLAPLARHWKGGGARQAAPQAWGAHRRGTGGDAKASQARP